MTPQVRKKGSEHFLSFYSVPTPNARGLTLTKINKSHNLRRQVLSTWQAQEQGGGADGEGAGSQTWPRTLGSGPDQEVAA